MKKYFQKLPRPLAALAALLFPVNSIEGHGLIGGDLAAAQTKNDLFVFFNLAPIQTSPSVDGGSIVTFKPTGEAFRALVTLRVTTNRKGSIMALQLSIARSFIDDRAKSIYAADLAKSFLAGAAEAPPGSEVHALINEISSRAFTGSTMTVLTRQPIPPVTDPPSKAYQTYAGRTEAGALSYSKGLQLRLNNVQEDGARVLSLAVSPKS